MITISKKTVTTDNEIVFNGEKFMIDDAKAIKIRDILLDNTSTKISNNNVAPVKSNNNYYRKPYKKSNKYNYTDKVINFKKYEYTTKNKDGKEVTKTRNYIKEDDKYILTFDKFYNTTTFHIVDDSFHSIKDYYKYINNIGFAFNTLSALNEAYKAYENVTITAKQQEQYNIDRYNKKNNQ